MSIPIFQFIPPPPAEGAFEIIMLDPFTQHMGKLRLTKGSRVWKPVNKSQDQILGTLRGGPGCFHSASTQNY